jgi:uncharacterized damage-inducible protein DinB
VAGHPGPPPPELPPARSSSSSPSPSLSASLSTSTGSAETSGREALLAAAVAAQCIELLRDTYLPRLQRALAELPPQDLWWRPHARSTSAGHLLLHLQGNIRQWIVSGLGGAEDLRVRDAEFAARATGQTGADAPDGAALLGALAATVSEACAVIERLDAARLLAPVVIQGIDTNGLGALLHVTEHMSWHTGQVAWIAKLRAGEGHTLAYYDDAALAARRPGPRAQGRRQP